MANDRSGFLGRLLRRGGEAGAPASDAALQSRETTIGLCFHYVRGMEFDNEYRTDAGTEQILKTLKLHGLRATFNVPARVLEKAPDQVMHIADAGHEIAVFGFSDESSSEMSEDGIQQLLYSCRTQFGNRGLHPIGFRSARSHWDPRMADALIRQGFVYSVEHDHAKHLYLLTHGERPLIRVPVYTDDRNLRRSADRHDATVSKHYRRLRRAIELKCFLSIAFHPHILAESAAYMEHWQTWLTGAIKSGARIGALADALPVRFRKSPARA